MREGRFFVHFIFLFFCSWGLNPSYLSLSRRLLWVGVFLAKLYNSFMFKTIATAESCTGGLLGALLTSSPGASDYYLGGAIAYHNRAKQVLLGVRLSTLKKYGAVSGQSAQEMAIGIQKRLKADQGIAITGIAGPGGGTAGKPVGLVYIALAGKAGVKCGKFLFKGSRRKIREQAAKTALNWLKRDGAVLPRRSK